jgi:OmpA family protein
MRHLLFGVVLLAGTGCSLITVKQEPFPPLEIRADRPAAPPSRVVLTDSSQILSVSFGLLDEVAKVLADNPQIELLEIDGHTDSTGTAAVNRKLSQQRAEAVMTYLTSKSVAAGRMKAKGFGPDKPIADNATDEGKEKNRRVEFNILKQGPKKTVVHDD